MGVFYIDAGLLQPCRTRSPQHLPVHPTDAQLASRRLDVTTQDIVVSHRCTFVRRLEHQIVWPVGPDDPDAPVASSSPDHHLQALEPVYPFKYLRFYRDSGLASFGLRGVPIASTVAFIDGDRIGSHVAPLQGSEFADPERSSAQRQRPSYCTVPGLLPKDRRSLIAAGTASVCVADVP